MRNRLICILLVLIAVAVALVATTVNFLFWPKYTRTYQHMAAPAPQDSQTDAEVLTSHLPLVLIETGGIVIEETVKQPVMISIIDNADGNNRVTDTPSLTTASLINIRGQTSLFFEKNQYRLDFIQSADDTKRIKHEVMGMPSESDWVLNAPYLDKSLVRNYMMYNLAGEIMEWSPGVRFCEVFLDGAYEGLYLMIEAVTVDEERVDIATETTHQGDTGFLLLREREGHTKTPIEEDCFCLDITPFELGIEYPNPTKLTPENKAYIVSRVNTFETKLYTLNHGKMTSAYADEIDIKSLVNYFVINEFCMNRDAGFFSTYTYCDPRSKLIMGPVWDFNNCFDNFFTATPYDQLSLIHNGWFSQIALDHIFANLVVWRYHELRESVLSEDRLLQLIDDIIAYLGPAANRNFERWGAIFDTPLLWLYENEEDRNSYSFEAAIEQLKNIIIQRGSFLDENLEILLHQNMETSTPMQY